MAHNLARWTGYPESRCPPRQQAAGSWHRKCGTVSYSTGAPSRPWKLSSSAVPVSTALPSPAWPWRRLGPPAEVAEHGVQSADHSRQQARAFVPGFNADKADIFRSLPTRPWKLGAESPDPRRSLNSHSRQGGTPGTREHLRPRARSDTIGGVPPRLPPVARNNEVSGRARDRRER